MPFAGLLAGHSAAAALGADAPRATQGLLSLLKHPGVVEAVGSDARIASAPAHVLTRFEADRLESRTPTAPPAPATAGAKAFLEQAKRQLTRAEYLQVRLGVLTRTRYASLARRRLTSVRVRVAVSGATQGVQVRSAHV
jgi:hypothetical protein